MDSAENGELGLKAAINGDYDLILLDVMMPELSGFDVCKQLREKGDDTPIILLTAKGEEIDKVLGLELGADDYITKPFGVRELLARIKAVLRRRSPQTEDLQEEEITIGHLTVNFHTYTAVNHEGESVKMSHREIEILQYLHKRKNEVVSRYDLLEQVWGYDETPTTRTVDNFIVKLRHKIEAEPNEPRIILTVHGAGYKLVV